MKEFKIRCSAIGQIMTNSRSKSEKLSKTTQSYLQSWVKEQLYNRTKYFTSKYTDKGNIMEDNSLDFIAEQLNYGMLLKNEENFFNDFMTGTPDVILKDHIIDVKNSWDNFTFPLFEKEIPNKDYFYQAQGYMKLTGLDSFKLIYVLSDTPINLIEAEAKKYCYSNGYEPNDEDVLNDFIKRMTYKDIAAKYKIKVFEIQRCEDTIKAIEERVIECRDYINELKAEL